jgi:5-methylcytosine-specific restriction endonuclease McrA
MRLPKCLVLNATNEFLKVQPWFRALRLANDTFIPEHYLNDPEFMDKPEFLRNMKLQPKVDVLEWYDEYAHSEGQEHRLPAVVRLRYCVQTKRKEKLNQPSLRNVLTRDNFTCQYCGVPVTMKSGTRDHVHPTAKGGPNTLENIVASCKRCNNLKGDMSLSAFESQFGFNLDKSIMRKLTEEEKIRSVIRSFKSKERNVWLKTLKENNIELW